MLKGILIEKNKASIVAIENNAIIFKKDIREYEPLIENDENDIELENLEIIRTILNSDDISSSKRRINNQFDLPMYFRVFHQDMVDEPKYFSCVNSDKTYDIPEICFILAIDPADTEDEKYMSIDKLIIWNEVIKHLMFYKDKTNKQQPIIVW